MRARLVRFYGFSNDEVKSMDGSEAFQYWQAITPLEAGETLLSLQLFKFEHMKKGHRRKFESRLHRDCQIKSKQLTTKELVANLARKLDGR